MKTLRVLPIALFTALSFGNLAGAQPAAGTDPSLDPHLFLTLKDFEARKAIAQREPWAKAALAGVLKEADGYPQDYLNEFGLTKVEAPKTAQWAHWYVCPETGTHLQFHPPNHNICPDTGKDYQDWPVSDVHYHICAARGGDPKDVRRQVQGLSDRRQLWEAIEHRSARLLADSQRVHLADRHDVCI
jgi:hypothetical protein